MSAEGVWVYAVVDVEHADSRARGVRGVAGEAVYTVAADDLAAVVGGVDLDEFGREALRRNLASRDWVTAMARAHDAVITAVARFGSVVPVRMATVYHSNARVREMIEHRRPEFETTLRRLSGRVEVGVQVSADPKRRDTSSAHVNGHRWEEWPPYSFTRLPTDPA